jgi:hypothetical protein
MTILMFFNNALLSIYESTNKNYLQRDFLNENSHVSRDPHVEGHPGPVCHSAAVELGHQAVQKLGPVDQPRERVCRIGGGQGKI